MQVVIRVPWKRPKNFVADLNSQSATDLATSSSVWTTERDAELWKLLALNPPDQVDCKSFLTFGIMYAGLIFIIMQIIPI